MIKTGGGSIAHGDGGNALNSAIGPCCQGEVVMVLEYYGGAVTVETIRSRGTHITDFRELRVGSVLNLAKGDN